MNLNRALVLLIALTPALAPAQPAAVGVAEPVVAVAPAGNAGLFVGVNDFTDPSITKLHYAVNDAIGLAGVFVIDLKLIPAAHATLALAGEPSTDEARRQLAVLTRAGVRRTTAGRTELLDELTRLQDDAGPDSMVVATVSAHGFQEAGRTYFMPADGRRRRLADTAIELRTFQNDLEHTKAVRRLIVIDACRVDAQRGGRDAGSAVDFTAAFNLSKGQATLLSCKPDEVSFEDGKLGQGVFTHFLIQALRGQAAADERGLINTRSVYAWTGERVADYTRRNVGRVQTPYWTGDHDAELIPLAVDSAVMRQAKQRQATTDKLLGDLKVKISMTATGFTYDAYRRLYDRVTAGQASKSLIQTAGQFAAGAITEDVFVAYLDKVLAPTAAAAPAAAAPVKVEASPLQSDEDAIRAVLRAYDNAVITGDAATINASVVPSSLDQAKVLDVMGRLATSNFNAYSVMNKRFGAQALSAANISVFSFKYSLNLMPPGELVTTVAGDTASVQPKVAIMAPKTITLRRVGGTWKIDGDSILPPLSDGTSTTIVFVFDAAIKAVDETAEDVRKGRTRDVKDAISLINDHARAATEAAHATLFPTTRSSH